MAFLAGLTPRNIITEALAGITLLAIAVPLNIGYAQIAGLPPTVGLYAMIVPTVAYALVVSSRQVVASPDAAGAALVASSLGGLAVAGTSDYLTLAFAQAFLCGVVFMVCAVLKLGFLANFLGKPILVGFVGGLALDILVSQFAKMLGVSIDSGADFVAKGMALASGLPTTNGWSVLIGIASVAVLVLGRRIARIVPWALVVLVVFTAVVTAAGLEAQGVSVLGPIEPGPPGIRWPVIEWTTWLLLVPSAIATTMVTMAEGLLVARSYGQKRGYPTNPDRDLLAFGVSNLAAGVTGGFTIGSSTSRTAAMDQAGSRTQLPTMVAALGTLMLVLFGTALLANIPSPAIGAIVAVAVFPLLGIREFVLLWRLQRFEFAIGGVCFLGTLLLGPVEGIILAFILAVTNLARRAANPAIDVLGGDDSPRHSLLPVAPDVTETAPGLVIMRFAGPIFFANATVFEDSVRKAVRAAGSGQLRHFVLDMEAVTDIDVTGSESLASTLPWLRDQGITVAYSRVRPDVEARLRHYGLIGDATMFSTNRLAMHELSGIDESD